tara:strand:- start:1190 stop:2341 length:1152 start_codon:yes stop_codon:yes gene_type:complete
MENTRIKNIKQKALDFVEKCKSEDYSYRLCLNSEISPYATCFAVFIRNLLKDKTLKDDSSKIEKNIINSIKHFHQKKDIKEKPFRQLLCFSLSALSILDESKPALLNKYVSEQLTLYSKDKSLYELGCLKGIPGSGNQAMFYAIFLIHAKTYLGTNTSQEIKNWIQMHIKHSNSFGFWGNSNNLKHIHFQNGYHQYEIFDYLGIKNYLLFKSKEDLINLSDKYGHFAPIIGGGGCYDYDAIFILTSNNIKRDKELEGFLYKIKNNLILMQNFDGGFPENKLIKSDLKKFYNGEIFHLLNVLFKPEILIERIRAFISVHRPRNKFIHTHWTNYSRKWDESDLWDTWFRLLAIARIEIFLDNKKFKEWNMINYPGIGFHHLLKEN